jgi:hypothetical protein
VLDFSELVSVYVVHLTGVLIGVFVLLVVIIEIVRWRSVLSPIVKARTLGATTWRKIFFKTFLNDAVYQQIQVGFNKE